MTEDCYDNGRTPKTAEDWARALAACCNTAMKAGAKADDETFLDAIKVIRQQAIDEASALVSRLTCIKCGEDSVVHLQFAENGLVRRWQEEPFEESEAFDINKLIMRVGTYKSKAIRLTDANATLAKRIDGVLNWLGDEIFDDDKKNAHGITQEERAEHISDVLRSTLKEYYTTETRSADTCPCVCCGNQSETATEDGADMCWPCMAGFLGTEYACLKRRAEQLAKALYPQATDEDMAELLDEQRPLPNPQSNEKEL